MTKNIYFAPVDLSRVTKIQHTGTAHVGELKNSIDFDAPEGTNILAALDGHVIDVKYDSDEGGPDQKFEELGNYIEILHANDEISEYEHLTFNSARVKVGDKVKTGQVVAQVGSTGWSECPHLHFMVYKKGSEYKTMEIVWDKSMKL
ncbi:M23 family metallopeptidase [Candidatus Uhrbacteria bacterium]|nr:M23 family metallopeptidase [Candidatus Uhrbacteria bacterium]